ncbi:hypothetical protein MN116_008337 [Schistosoma mekongi]|uniref:Protein FRA10AC1 n=1 Tax=Schistosoma mekongi TaxID=38744 RepID=A0AAE2D2P3_SCHME|nr:hypothetical protein MN116_008337 [Schistosoma mekongi]
MYNMYYSSKDKTDVDVIREHGRFLWSEEDEPTSWSERLAKKYWEKLFKEYCLVDLSRYKENKFGMRWRLEKEVISGKGQFTCGNVACPAGSERLRSWEVNFVYQERGERRNALVKIRLCPPCSEKLNYRYRRRDITGQQLTNSHQANNNDNNVVSSTASSSSSIKRRRITNDSDDDNNDETISKDKFTDMNSVWCCTSGRQSTQSSGISSAVVNKHGGDIKTQDDEFDEYFADMLM